MVYVPTWKPDAHGITSISVLVACITPVVSKLVDINISYNPHLIVPFGASADSSPNDSGCWQSRSIAEQSNRVTFIDSFVLQRRNGCRNYQDKKNMAKCTYKLSRMTLSLLESTLGSM